MFKRILVAVDGSPTSQRGFKTALGLAKENGAQLFAVHVLDELAIAHGLYGATYIPAEYLDSARAALRDGGLKILASVRGEADSCGQAVEPVLVENLGSSIPHAILAEARKLRADLIGCPAELRAENRRSGPGT